MLGFHDNRFVFINIVNIVNIVNIININIAGEELGMHDNRFIFINIINIVIIIISIGIIITILGFFAKHTTWKCWRGASHPLMVSYNFYQFSGLS